MYRHLEHRLAQRVRECLEHRYPGVALPRVIAEQPPKVELGDFAIPIFPFAKPLRSAPLKIAEAIRAEIGPIEGIAEMPLRMTREISSFAPTPSADTASSSNCG